MMKKAIEIGYIEKGTGKHQSNVVYSLDGLCPTIPASTGVKEPPKMFLEEVSNEQLFNAEREREREYLSKILQRKVTHMLKTVTELIWVLTGRTIVVQLKSKYLIPLKQKLIVG